MAVSKGLCVTNDLVRTGLEIKMLDIPTDSMSDRGERVFCGGEKYPYPPQGRYNRWVFFCSGTVMDMGIFRRHAALRRGPPS